MVCFLRASESSDGSLLEEVGNNDINQEVLQTIQSMGNSKLDGSCVLVDGSEVHSSSHKVEKRWSYKVLALALYVSLSFTIMFD